MQLMITSTPPPDFKQVWRAGRPWPKEGVLVEYNDKLSDDPPADKQPKEGPKVIGRKTFDALKEDPRILIRTPGAADAAVTASAALVEAKTENEKLKAALAESHDEADKLKARVVELETQLAAKSKSK